MGPRVLIFENPREPVGSGLSYLRAQENLWVPGSHGQRTHQKPAGFPALGNPVGNLGSGNPLPLQANITAPMVDISNNGITEDIIAHLCNTLSHTDLTEVGPDVDIPRWHYDGMTDPPSNEVAGNVDKETDGDANDFQCTKINGGFFRPCSATSRKNGRGHC